MKNIQFSNFFCICTLIDCFFVFPVFLIVSESFLFLKGTIYAVYSEKKCASFRPKFTDNTRKVLFLVFAL